jgi:ribosomal-protein-serine acetyltransferase
MIFLNYHIRLIESSDQQSYFHLIESNRPRLEDFFAGTVSKTKTLEDTVKFIDENIEKMNDRKYFPFIVIDTTNNRIAGFIDVKNIDWNIPKAELGCFVDRNYENKGLSSKALEMVIDHLFEEYKFAKLFLRTHENNASARKLAEKCGFEMEGRIRKDYKTTKGELVDLIYYGKLKE